jgi:hypothetical protein
MKEKVLIILVCVIGLTAVFYGMVRDNNWVFVTGLMFVAGGYLMIRKRLKASINKRT